ncbi:MAG: class I SAM-dependent methyltransferase [Acidiferrobacterales bacterium]|nr:class I SAM-dependent methyltransferase [Acidiferrobacterales bacterium]
MLDHASHIKSMKLYTHIERIHNELAELGKSTSDPLNADEISGFDQLHYHGTKAVDEAMAMMSTDQHTRVLEIGSGFGGPARHIASSSGAHVTALELQPDQNALAAELTERCGLSNLVEHVCGDFLTYPWDAQQFDTIVSWLAIFHISDRHELLQISSMLLPQGGLFFTEDMYCRAAMSDAEARELKEGMYTGYMPDLETYKKDFVDAGFEILRCDEMSNDWTEFTTDRLIDYRNGKERHVRVHDESTYLAMEEFYDLVNRHFRSGKLGGVRLMARKI